MAHLLSRFRYLAILVNRRLQACLGLGTRPGPVPESPIIEWKLRQIGATDRTAAPSENGLTSRKRPLQARESAFPLDQVV